jgi:hypothetical protein
VYIEEVANKQAERKEKWLGKVPGWTQATVTTLPTRTGRRVQGGALDYLALTRSANDAAGAIQKHTAGAFIAVSGQLDRSFGATADATALAFITSSLGFWRTKGILGHAVKNYAAFVDNVDNGGDEDAAWALELRARIATWHGRRATLQAMLGRLGAQERAIAVLLDTRDDWVQARLHELSRVAVHDDTGLADFIRVALAKLGEDPKVAPSDGLRGALARWRSAYNGKDLLSRGFEKADRRAIVAHIGPTGTAGIRAGALRTASDRRIAERKLAEERRLAEEQARLEKARLAQEQAKAKEADVPQTLVDAVATKVVDAGQGARTKKRTSKQRHKDRLKAGGSAKPTPTGGSGSTKDVK